MLHWFCPWKGHGAGRRSAHTGTALFCVGLKSLKHLFWITGGYWLLVAAFCWLAERVRSERLFIVACALTLFAYGVLCYLCF